MSFRLQRIPEFLPPSPPQLKAGIRGLRAWVQLPPVSSFPVESSLVMAVAGLVGLFAGLASGLFANFIAFFQIVFFQPAAMVRAFTGRDHAWSEHLREALHTAPWHLEYFFVGLVGFAAARLIARYLAKHPEWHNTLLTPGRVRAIGWFLGFGVVLYYPLLILTTINRSFDAIHGSLPEWLAHVPMVWRVLGPAIGGLGVGLLVNYVTPESGGHGVVEVIETVHTPGKRIPARVALWKSLIAGLTMGSGGSAGREGPSVQIGAALANELGIRFGVSPESVRVLLACGGAAGIAAAFNSPIGGTMFALEVILRDIDVKSVAPIAFSAVAATVTGRALAHQSSEIARVPFHLVSGIEIGPYLLLGALSALVAVLYVRAVHGVEEAFAHGPRLKTLKPALRPMLGGLAVGLIGLATPRALGNGYESVNLALTGQLAAGALLFVLLAKIVATGMTLGSGAPGGSFFPAVFMGAMLGGAFGSLGHRLLPTVIAGSGEYAAVGMAAVVAGATEAPLTGVMMLFELTGSYEIILPLMVACATAVAGVHWVLGGSMYVLKLRSKGVNFLARRQPAAQTLVASIMTRDVMTIGAEAPFEQVVALLRSTNHGAYPVVDAEGKLVGVITLDELRPHLGRTQVTPLSAGSMCRRSAPFVRETESVEAALARMHAEHVDHLPVLAAESSRVIGILTQRDLLRASTGLVTPVPTAA